jgi:hypothetical protein
MGVYLLYRLCLVSKKASNDSLHLVEAPPPRDFDFEGLEIETQVSEDALPVFINWFNLTSI